MCHQHHLVLFEVERQPAAETHGRGKAARESCINRGLALERLQARRCTAPLRTTWTAEGRSGVAISGLFGLRGLRSVDICVTWK